MLSGQIQMINHILAKKYIKENSVIKEIMDDISDTPSRVMLNFDLG